VCSTIGDGFCGIWAMMVEARNSKTGIRNEPAIGDSKERWKIVGSGEQKQSGSVDWVNKDLQNRDLVIGKTG
jgi:hypothetical protein